MAIPTEMYFVSVTSPVGIDTNDGFDVFGLNSTGDTWTHATLTLTSTSHGLSPAVGEIMYISSASAGNAGWYTIASNDANDIVMTALVAGVDIGSDQTDIVTSDGAWLTINKAMDTVTAGDKVWVRGGTDYGEIVEIHTVGTNIAPIIWEGYTTIPGDDGTFEIDGASTRANCLISDLSSSTSTYNVFKNMICTGATDNGINLNLRAMVFKRCTIHTNTDIGVSISNSNNSIDECIIHSNGSGINDVGLIFGTLGSITNCEIYGNYGTGATQTSGVIYNCVSYNNGNAANKSANLRMIENTGMWFIGNTTDGRSINNITGIWYDGSALRQVVMMNNIAYNHDGTNGIGIEWDLAMGETAVSRNNLVNSNAADYDLAETFVGEVTGAPDFVDDANGDYILNSGSPAKAAGVDAGDAVNDVSYTDIGAQQRQEPAGGGAPGRGSMRGGML